MTSLAIETLVSSIVVLFSEAYEGPADKTASWFIDNEPDSGILGVLKGVSAAEASTSVDRSGKPGTTIAANVEHLRWSLANVNGALLGQAYNTQWKESWTMLDADEAAWDQLRAELRSEFETLRQAIGRQEDLPGILLNGLLALIPHAAYHLGTIRQMIERVRE